MRWEYYILGLLLRMPSWPLNRKQFVLWKLPVIVFTYSFRGRTPGLAVVGAVSCRGSRPRLCLAQSEWNRSGPQICAHLWLQRGKDCREIRQQWKVFSPERSAEEPPALPPRPGCPGGRLICSQKLQVRRKSVPRARLSHLGTPTPHFSFSPMPPFKRANRTLKIRDFFFFKNDACSKECSWFTVNPGSPQGIPQRKLKLPGQTCYWRKLKLPGQTRYQRSSSEVL